jgi:hypothetical protein
MCSFSQTEDAVVLSCIRLSIRAHHVPEGQAITCIHFNFYSKAQRMRPSIVPLTPAGRRVLVTPAGRTTLTGFAPRSHGCSSVCAPSTTSKRRASSGRAPARPVFIDIVTCVDECWERLCEDVERYAIVRTPAHPALCAHDPKDMTKIPTSVTSAMRRVSYAKRLDVAYMQPMLDAAAKAGVLTSAISARDLIAKGFIG